MSENQVPDLTPTEARSEVEAFMGEGWSVQVWPKLPMMFAAHASGRVNLCYDGSTTYRAAVAALKQAWRDAVRPWCSRTLDEAEDAIVSWESGGGDRWEYQDDKGNTIQPAAIVARVLGEDM